MTLIFSHEELHLNLDLVYVKAILSGNNIIFKVIVVISTKYEKTYIFDLTAYFCVPKCHILFSAKKKKLKGFKKKKL